MQYHQTSKREITVESYVTARDEWPEELRRNVDEKYNARGVRLVGCHMEWQFFTDVAAAAKWAEVVHTPPAGKSKVEVLLAALHDAQQALAHAIHRLKDDGSFSTSIALKGTEAKVNAALGKVK